MRWIMRNLFTEWNLLTMQNYLNVTSEMYLRGIIIFAKQLMQL